MKSFLLVLSLVLSVAFVVPAGDALAQETDPRDVKARALFTTGKYQDALELYGQLYAETLHAADVVVAAGVQVDSNTCSSGNANLTCGLHVVGVL